MTLDVDAGLELLGGLSPAQFMRRHWQRRPCLVRAGALPWVRQIPRQTLFALAANEAVESRCVEQQPTGWRLRHGPLKRLPPLARPAWTLLVQGMEAHWPAARSLLDAFRFLPEARLDDVMVSWASEGGGVGAHVDAYDVFLVQIEGQRRWRVSAQRDQACQSGLPLRILQDFRPQQEWLLQPGDWLYLPPGWAHEGVAVGGACITASVGFRAPSAWELAAQLLPRLLDDDEDEAPASLRRRYRDVGAPATATPALLPDALQVFAQQALQQVLADPARVARALGEWLSEPKPQLLFASRGIASAGGVQLAAASRMLVDARHVFFNGESYRASGRDARLMAQLANTRSLPGEAVAQLSPAAHALLVEWLEWGWLWPINLLPR